MFALKLDVRACTRLLSVAAAARRSPLLLPGARTSSFKANIDPQPPSTVVEMARQQSGDQVRLPQRVGGHGVRPPRKTRQPRTRKTS